MPVAAPSLLWHRLRSPGCPQTHHFPPDSLPLLGDGTWLGAGGGSPSLGTSLACGAMHGQPQILPHRTKGLKRNPAPAPSVPKEPGRGEGCVQRASHSHGKDGRERRHNDSSGGGVLGGLTAPRAARQAAARPAATAAAQPRSAAPAPGGSGSTGARAAPPARGHPAASRGPCSPRWGGARGCGRWVTLGWGCCRCPCRSQNCCCCSARRCRRCPSRGARGAWRQGEEAVSQAEWLRALKT